MVNCMGENGMKIKITKTELICVMSLVLIWLMAAPAAAYYSDTGFPVVTRTSGTFNGSVYIGTTAPSGGSFEVPNGTVLWARLYTGVWGGTSGNTGWENITFNGDCTSNGLGPIHLEGASDSNPNVWCTGCGKYWIYYDVANLVNSGSVNTATNMQINGTICGPAYATVLVVVLEGGDNPKNITYWVNDGSKYAPCTTYFNGNVDMGFVNGANLTMMHITAFEPACATCLKFTGHTLDTSMITSNKFDMNTWNVFGYMSSSGNNAWSNNGEDEYVTIASAILIVENGEDETPPYTIDHDPAPNATWVPRETDIIVHVRDGGAGVDTSTITMTVDDVDVTGSVSIIGTKTDYTLIYNPPSDFEYEQVVNVTVDASDLASNTMNTDVYSFTIKGIDYWQPYTTGHDPAPDETNVLIDSDIMVHVRDDYDGVDLSTIVMTVNGVDVTGSLAITGTPANYSVIYDPPVNFSYKQVVNVTINASDLNTTPNVVQDAYSFTVEAYGSDLIVSVIDAYHGTTYFPDPNIPPCFNLSNEVDVKVENTGSVAASESNLSLYADDEFIGKMGVSAIGARGSTVVQFKWTPAGCDCDDGCDPATYTLKAVVDCDNNVVELNETNNESTAQETAYWAGYSADESLVTVINGTIRGGLLYTTGDGVYRMLYDHGDITTVHYGVNLPSGATVALARLNVYHTWSKHDYPLMEVKITNQTGTYPLPLTVSYNDRPCDNPAISFDYPFGNYVYNLTPYIRGSGSYTVTVKNNGTATNESDFCIPAPGIVVLYQDDTKPLHRYWILEGADVLEGGRREGGGNLALEECINNVTFEGNINMKKVADAVLGLATPWGGGAWGDYCSYLYFNGDEIGKDVYHGYGTPHNRTLGSISMYVGGTGAQMGVNVTNVSGHLNLSNNVVGQGDDGDSMMAANAFLFVEYETKAPSPFFMYGWVFHGDKTECNSPAVNITNQNTGEKWQAETDPAYNYYQVLISSHNVSTGDLLRICDVCGGNVTAFNHTVAPEEIDNGGFEQNITNAGDLVITGIWNECLDNCTICYRIMNMGHAAVPAGHNTTLYVDGIEMACDEVPVELTLDASYEGCFDGYNWTYNPPADNITVCADSNDMVVEIGESNNCQTKTWACGDVNDDGVINMADVMTLWYCYANYPTPGAHEISNVWAADVNCDDRLNMADVMTLWYDYANYPTPGAHEVNCC